LIIDLVQIVLSLAVILGTAGIIYATCAPIHQRTSAGSELGRSMPASPVFAMLGRFLTGMGWGLFAAVVVFAAVYLVMDLHR
jgi:hypothetical protein